jgi:hypothetical protein
MKKNKIRQRKYIEKGSELIKNDESKKGKKHIRKPKMPARIKKTPKVRQK